MCRLMRSHFARNVFKYIRCVNNVAYMRLYNGVVDVKTGVLYDIVETGKLATTRFF